MKRVLYWIGLLMIVGVALMPDVLVPPLASAGHVLAQDSTQQTPSEQQYSDLTEADLISKGCALSGIVGEDGFHWPGVPEGSKVYRCYDSSPPCDSEGEPQTVFYRVYPDGTVVEIGRACAAIAEPTEGRQGGSGDSGVTQDASNAETGKSPQAPPQGTSKHPAQRCQPADELSDGTKVSICGDNILFEYPDGTAAWASPVQTQQDGGQQGADQGSNDQQQDGGQQGADQGSDGQQQDGDQQGASRQGYGCALLE
jgi:hypothetical protein